MTEEKTPSSPAELQVLLEEYKQQIFRLEHDLLKQKRNEILVQMAGSIAHDISQPLTVILSNIDLIRMRNLVQDERLNVLFQRVATSSSMIADIVKRIQTVYQTGAPMLGRTEHSELDELNCRACLVIDDDELYDKVSEFLSQQEAPYELVRMPSMQMTLDDVSALFPDIIIIDFSIPNPKPLEFIHLTANNSLDIPIVLLVDTGAERAASSALNMGVIDYLPKQCLTRGGLHRLVRNSIKRFWLNQEIERARTRAEGEQPLDSGATEIGHRYFFNSFLDKEFHHALDYHDTLTVAVVAIDGWTVKAQQWSNEFRNRLLLKIGKNIKALSRKSDVCARLEAGVFGLILPSTGKRGALNLAERLGEELRTQTFSHEGEEAQLTASVGLATLERESSTDALALYEQAKAALEKAQAAGGDRIVTTLD